jgi:hypothetical protein
MRDFEAFLVNRVTPRAQTAQVVFEPTHRPRRHPPSREP